MSEVEIVLQPYCLPCMYKVHRECEGDHCDCPCKAAARQQAGSSGDGDA